MKNKVFILSMAVIASFLLISISNASAQIRYESNKLTLGTIEPYKYYTISAMTTGMYFTAGSGRFFQIDCTTSGAPRMAGHNDQVVFYNSQSGTFNKIQVQQVLNYSDARAKTGIRNLGKGMDIIKRLRPVSYNFVGNQARVAANNEFTGDNVEFGLLAQELEAVLPNLVFTDDEGRKLVDYISLIPVLIDAVKSLQEEVDALKSDIK